MTDDFGWRPGMTDAEALDAARRLIVHWRRKYDREREKCFEAEQRAGRKNVAALEARVRELDAENASLRRSVAMLKASYRDERGLARLPPTPPAEVLVWVSAAIDHGIAAATKIAPNGDTYAARAMLADVMATVGKEPMP